jgi:hypothetical protein
MGLNILNDIFVWVQVATNEKAALFLKSHVLSSGRCGHVGINLCSWANSNDADVSSSAPSLNYISIITGPMDDKENLPISSKGKTTTIKKRYCDSNSEPDSPHPRNTKCVCSLNIQAHLETSSTEWREFQDKLMEELKEGNHIIAESAQRTADFQDNLLKVFAALIPPTMSQN